MQKLYRIVFVHDGVFLIVNYTDFLKSKDNGMVVMIVCNIVQICTPILKIRTL